MLSIIKINPVYFLITALIFLFLFNIYLSPIISINSIYQLIIITGTMLILELSIHFLKKQRRFFFENAIISSLIITGIISEQTPIIYLFLIAAIASLSSEMLRMDNRPVFNPAALSLILTSWINPSLNYIWWINHPSAIVIPLICLIIVFTHKERIVFSFLAILLTTHIAKNLNNPELISIFINTIYSLAFFTGVMLIEPKTSPINNKNQYIFGSAVALFYILLNNNINHALLVALIIGNTIALILNKITLSEHDHSEQLNS